MTKNEFELLKLQCKFIDLQGYHVEIEDFTLEDFTPEHIFKSIQALFKGESNEGFTDEEKQVIREILKVFEDMIKNGERF